MENNEQKIDLIDLLMNDIPKDAIENNTTLTYNVQFGQFGRKTPNFTFPLLVSELKFCNQITTLTHTGKHQFKHYKQKLSNLANFYVSLSSPKLLYCGN